jgi:hypothetical protein
MLSKLRNLLVRIYIHLSGVRFYSSKTLPIKEEFRRFIVKTMHGYEITFTFYKEKRNFIQYYFKNLKTRSCVVYVVSATFDDAAPELVRRYNNMRIFVDDSSFFLSDENAIVMVLLHVYLDYLLHEMRTCINQNTREVDKVDNITDATEHHS